jgi:hypothetical protein
MILFGSVQNRIRIELKGWIRIRIQVNPDSQPWPELLFCIITTDTIIPPLPFRFWPRSFHLHFRHQRRRKLNHI